VVSEIVKIMKTEHGYKGGLVRRTVEVTARLASVVGAGTAALGVGLFVYADHVDPNPLDYSSSTSQAFLDAHYQAMEYVSAGADAFQWGIIGGLGGLCIYALAGINKNSPPDFEDY
jgi:hypothetical protein